MVDGVVRLKNNVEQVGQSVVVSLSSYSSSSYFSFSTFLLDVVVIQEEMTEEELLVMEDEALSSQEFVDDLRSEFVEHLCAMKALSAHGPV